jgi:GAF domain-containing protein
LPLCVDNGGYLMAWVGYAEEDQAKTVRPVAQAGYESGYLETINISWGNNPQGQGPTGTAIRTGTPHIIQNILTNASMAPWRQAALERGYQSSVSLPLICDAKILGALNIYACEADAFDPAEVHFWKNW